MRDSVRYEDDATDPGRNRTPLETIEAVIRDRRSVKRFLDRPVPRELLVRLIEAAVWAPNHRLNEPWRFYVLDGASRDRLGEVAREVTRAKMTASGAPAAAVERKAIDAAAGWASVPALLYVTALIDPDPETNLENYGAACCAVQNLMLAAHATGLGTSWSSGAVAAASGLRALAGASPDERMVALLRIGYPDLEAPPPVSRRGTGADHTTWVDGA
jgi:nitroreductase